MLAKLKAARRALPLALECNCIPLAGILVLDMSGVMSAGARVTLVCLHTLAEYTYRVSV